MSARVTIAPARLTSSARTLNGCGGSGTRSPWRSNSAESGSSSNAPKRCSGTVTGNRSSSARGVEGETGLLSEHSGNAQRASHVGEHRVAALYARPLGEASRAAVRNLSWSHHAPNTWLDRSLVHRRVSGRPARVARPASRAAAAAQVLSLRHVPGVQPPHAQVHRGLSHGGGGGAHHGRVLSLAAGTVGDVAARGDTVRLGPRSAKDRVHRIRRRARASGNDVAGGCARLRQGARPRISVRDAHARRRRHGKTGGFHRRCERPRCVRALRFALRRFAQRTRRGGCLARTAVPGRQTLGAVHGRTLIPVLSNYPLLFTSTHRGDPNMPLTIGDNAPDFTADTTEGRINFHEWLSDSWGVLFSHPKDFTPVCTTELGYMAKIKPEFDKRNTKIIGISVDSTDDHEGWLNDIEETQGTRPNYPIIGDDSFEVAKAWGMMPAEIEGDATDRTPVDNQTVRNVFVIGPDKKIKLILVYPMTTGRNFDEVLRVIDSLQLTANNKVATPAQWNKGDDVIISGSVKEDEAKELWPEGWESPKPYIRIVPDPSK